MTAHDDLASRKAIMKKRMKGVKMRSLNEVQMIVRRMVIMMMTVTILYFVV